MYRGRGQSVQSDNCSSLSYHSIEQATPVHGPMTTGVPYQDTYNHIMHTSKHMQHCVRNDTSQLANRDLSR